MEEVNKQDEQKQKYTVVRSYTRTDTYEVEAINKEEADNVVDYSDDLLPIHIGYEWDHNGSHTDEDWASDIAGWEWGKMGRQTIQPNVPKESLLDRKHQNSTGYASEWNAEIDAVEALGTLEDRVTALETWSEEVELEKENRS